MKKKYLTTLIFGLLCLAGYAQVGYQNWYRDADNDTYGTGTNIIWASYPPVGYTYRDGDCNDNDNQINPGMSEICDGKDNNCDGQIDNGTSVAAPPQPVVDNNCTSSILYKPSQPGGITYYWQSSATGTSTSNSSSSITRFTGSVYYIRAKSNSGNCWSPATAVNYSIIGTPTQATGSNVAICSGENVTLTASPGGSGTTIHWYNDPTDGGVLHIGTSYSLTNVTSSQSYWAESYYDDGSGGCAATTRKQITVTVNPVPSAATGSDRSRCGNGSVTLTATGPSGSAIRWYNAPSGGTLLATTNSYTTPSLTKTATYYAESYIGSCKAVTRTPIQAIIYPDLNPGTISGAQTICYNLDPGNLTSTANASGCAGNYVYQWQYNTTSGTATSGWNVVSGGNGTSVDPTTSLTNDRWYRRRVTSNGMVAYSNVIKITVRSPLSPGSISYNGGDVCFGENPSNIANNSLPTGGDNIYSYQWQYRNSGNTNWTNITSTNSPSYDPPSGLNVTRSYQRLVSSCGETKASNTITITANPNPSLPIGPDIVPICGSGSETITMTPGTNGNRVRWYTDQSGGNHFFEGNSYTTPVFSADTNYYISTYNNTTGCESTDRKTVAVVVSSEIIYYLDADGDGYAISTTTACSNPGTGYTTAVLPLGDCDDSKAVYNPDTVWYLDVDGDGYAASSQQSCTSPGANYVLNITGTSDCNDDDANVFEEQIWYLDADGDGHAISNQVSCGSPGMGYVLTITSTNDCDNDTQFNPANTCSPPVGESDLDITFSGDNYVYSRTYQEPNTSATAFFTTSTGLIQDITYFDGLGRPIQQIALEQSPEINDGKADIVTQMKYDDYGRMVEEWLPVPMPTGTFGEVKIAVETAITEHYNTAKYEWTTNPYSEKEFEASPLNRLEKQAAPGNAWALGTGHEIEFDHMVNEIGDNVRLFYVTTSFADNTYTPSLELDTDTNTDRGEFYETGELYKNVTYDENHSGTSKLHSTEEFTDKQGQVVLKRTYGPFDEDDSGSIDLDEEELAFDTYYVYDDFGNLTYVLPPKMEATTASLTDINNNMQELGYQYVYDHRNRLVQKWIPGKQGWENIVYDKLDRPIMTQDPNLAANNEWLFTKYDAFGRVAYSGKATDNRNRIDVQTSANGVTGDLWVNTGTYNDGSVNVGYENAAYPTSGISEVLTINYYDGYDPAWATMGTTVTAFGVNSTPNVKGLATGTKVKVLDVSGSNVWITTVTFYDEKARPIYTHTNNSYLGTIDIVSSELDFVGRPLKVRSAHIRGSTNVVTLDNFTYDHVGRLLTQTQCIGDDTLGNSCDGVVDASGTEANPIIDEPIVDTDQVAKTSITLRAPSGQSIVLRPASMGSSTTLRIDSDLVIQGSGTLPSSAEELIVSNTYDELGQLESKEVGGDPAGSGLQTVDYAYNVRGWLKEINDVGNTNRLFNFRLMYNDAAQDPLFNGNIASAQWRTANSDNAVKSYHYTYDALNRITAATDNTGNYDVSNITYDKMGNLRSLTRDGWQNGSYPNMDIIAYDYDGGNKLLSTYDYGNPNYGYKDEQALNAQDYWYDANGNMVRDLNKGIGTTAVDGITYNHLNLPVEVKFDNDASKTISYVYDATGTKLEKKVVDNGPGNSTEYAGNYVYLNGIPQFFSHPEGYVNIESAGYYYVYQYKDHLGNVRLSYTENPDPNIDTPVIIEENNYYPFGLKHKGYNEVVSPQGNSVAQKWKYNGVEFEEALDLDLYEMDFRSYDASIGRFMTVDPLAELVEQLDKSPYAFAWNNPIFYNDPLGLCPDCPDPEDAKQGDTYTIDNGSVYVFNNGEWERQTVEELDEVVVTADGPSDSSTSEAKGPLFVPVPKPVAPPVPPTAAPYNPGLVGLAVIWATFYTPDTSPYSPANIAETLNPENARGLKRDESAVMRVQVQQGTTNIASTTATNTAQQGVTTLQADVALVATRELARQQLKKVLSSVQAQRAFAKMAKKIQSAPANGGIVAGTRTTLQETFIYNNTQYRIDVESIKGHNLRQ